MAVRSARSAGEPSEEARARTTAPRAAARTTATATRDGDAASGHDQPGGDGEGRGAGEPHGGRARAVPGREQGRRDGGREQQAGGRPAGGRGVERARCRHRRATARASTPATRLESAVPTTRAGPSVGAPRRERRGRGGRRRRRAAVQRGAAHGGVAVVDVVPAAGGVVDEGDTGPSSARRPARASRRPTRARRRGPRAPRTERSRLTTSRCSRWVVVRTTVRTDAGGQVLADAVLGAVDVAGGGGHRAGGGARGDAEDGEHLGDPGADGHDEVVAALVGDERQLLRRSRPCVPPLVVAAASCGHCPRGPVSTGTVAPTGSRTRGGDAG